MECKRDLDSKGDKVAKHRCLKVDLYFRKGQCYVRHECLRARPNPLKGN